MREKAGILFKILPHVLFVILIAEILAPTTLEIENRIPFIFVVSLFEIYMIIRWKDKSIYKINTIIYLFFIYWDFKTSKTAVDGNMLIPAPENVFHVFLTDYPKILQGIGSSFKLLGIGFSLSIILGVVLGLVIGWFQALREAIMPIVRVVSPIPPIIYAPYAVALMPTFESAQIFVIFISMFWGVFLNVVMRVSSVEKEILDSAKTLNLKSGSMLFHILLPYCLPAILEGITSSLGGAFMVLTAAEMIGAASGIGWFVKFYSDFADYTRVVAGIIVIGIVVTVLNGVIQLLGKILIKYKQ